MPSTETGPLVGREAETRRLDRVVRRVPDGAGPQVVVLSGEAGIGKSRLARHTLDRARAAGYTTLAGASGPLQRDLSFAPVVEALRPLVREGGAARRASLVDGLSDLGRLFDGLGLPPPVPLGDAGLERTRLHEAICRLLQRACDRAPVAVLVDDVQWADPASLSCCTTSSAGSPAARSSCCLPTAAAPRSHRTPRRSSSTPCAAPAWPPSSRSAASTGSPWPRSRGRCSAATCRTPSSRCSTTVRAASRCSSRRWWRLSSRTARCAGRAGRGGWSPSRRWCRTSSSRCCGTGSRRCRRPRARCSTSARCARGSRRTPCCATSSRTTPRWSRE